MKPERIKELEEKGFGLGTLKSKDVAIDECVIEIKSLHAALRKCAEKFREYEGLSGFNGERTEFGEMAELCEKMLDGSTERTYTESEVMQWTRFYHGCLDKHVQMPEEHLNKIWEAWLKHNTGGK